MSQKKQWRDLTTAQKFTGAVLGIIQVGLLAAALWDIQHRSADEINGTKKMWRGLVLINYIGPIAYFIIGRKESLWR